MLDEGIKMKSQEASEQSDPKKATLKRQETP